jgi:hypothetical protein
MHDSPLLCSVVDGVPASTQVVIICLERSCTRLRAEFFDVNSVIHSARHHVVVASVATAKASA